jgi:beta-lactamase regulating signal transducer with metallopeptidase domain
MNQLLIEFIIKTTLIAACTGIALCATRIRNAAARHRAWTSVMLVMLVLPLWIAWGPKASIPYAPSLFPQAGLVVSPSENPIVISPSISTAQDPQRSAPPTSWDAKWFVLGIYLLGVWTLIVRLVVGTIYAQRLVTQAVLEGEHFTNPSCAVPVTLGLIHPITILPNAWQNWPPRQLEVVLAHEREHVRRHDPLFQWLALLNRALFWFHPLAWWLERRLSFLAEQACDDAVLARGCSPDDYSGYLLAMERAVIRSGKRLGLIGARMPGSALERRIKQILEGVPAPAVSRKRAACAIAACTISCGLFAAGTLEQPSAERTQPLTEAATGLRSEPSSPQAAVPKWVGTWRLNKQKSNFGRDLQVPALLDSIESFALTLDSVPDGVTFTTELVGTRPVIRQHAEVTLKFGETTSLKDINPFMGVAFPGTLVIVPVSDNSLNLSVTYSNGSGVSSLHLLVSSDGRTMTESVRAPDLSIVFDRQI